ncbi:NAD(P)/FAD-dependent oxidoreductase [Haloechinothrix sp. LS1_15]|uniref:dihydrolipoyl dehydrogenase family protein n=1 Tax=Haloechinothrix sp. LS1_15 TaxID=2652248 RepID=UPI0029462F90|nr:NAD(P)/FAD-dependent oxidoreductase [Haloechinothrix sp. LS1_15]MDV6011850.1 NAD(P)/FAD-dependent oxidoreductase [Haloechinothrix sp. LS1_15]
MADQYDVVVVGGGAVGENAAGRCAQHGLTVAVVEEHLLGGECSYYACMPSKALLRPGEVMDAVRRVPGAREAVTGELDAASALRRRDKLASYWDDGGQQEWVAGQGIDLFRGHGRLTGERAVEVADEHGSRRLLHAHRAVVLATGSRAAVPPVEGIGDIGVWDSRDITTAREVPERLVVLGGGVVGVEMAQAWRTLGARIVLVEMAERLLSAEEPFAGAEVAEALRELGVEVYTGTQVTSVSRASGDGPVTATLDGGPTVEADEFVVAVGRSAITEDLGLDTVGLEPGGYLETDDSLRVRGVEGDWLYAVGDCNGRNLLTHMGKYQARIAGDVIAGKPNVARADHGITPRVVFTTPLVGAVGLTEAGARASGYRIDTVSHDTGGVAGAVTKGGGLSGTSKLVIDTDRRMLLGATFTGPAADELVHAATIAIAGEVPLDTLWHAVPSFPTVSEVWLRLLESYGL